MELNQVLDLYYYLIIQVYQKQNKLTTLEAGAAYMLTVMRMILLLLYSVLLLTHLHKLLKVVLASGLITLGTLKLLVVSRYSVVLVS
jgi:hypothetical protein